MVKRSARQTKQINNTLSQKLIHSRVGMASIEAVVATAIGFPVAAGLFFLCIKGCKLLYQLTTVLVGSPFL